MAGHLNVFDDDSPALSLVFALADRGIDLRVSDDGQRLQAFPADAVTPADAQALRDHKAAVLAIVGCTDDKVWDRVRAFRQQPDTDAPVLVPGIKFVPTTCWSCLARVSRVGRCWRCRLAFRLARRLPIDPEVMTTTDPSPVPVQSRSVHGPEHEPDHEHEPEHVPVPEPSSAA